MHRTLEFICLAFVAAMAWAVASGDAAAQRQSPSRKHNAMTDTGKSPVSAPSVKDALAVRLEAESEYVLGLPLPMAITLRATQAGATVNLLPEPSPFALGGSIGFVLQDTGGQTVAAFDAPGAFDMTHDPPPLSLNGGEERRFLIDLSEVMPAVKPGRYRLAISYEAPARRTHSAPVEVAFRDPTDAELAWIRKHQLALAEAGSWGRWVTLPPTTASLPSKPATAPSQARFAAVCQAIFHDTAALASTDPALLSSVSGIARAEASIMQLELLRATGQTQTLSQSAQTLHTTYPTLSWLVQRALAGTGLISTYRYAK